MTWRDFASCIGTDVNAFFMPDTDGMTDIEIAASKSTFQASTRAVARMCADCAVFTECRLLSLAETDGYFAGAGSKARERMRGSHTRRGIAIPELRRMVTDALADLDAGTSWDRALERAGLEDHPFFHEFDTKQLRKGSPSKETAA